MWRIDSGACLLCAGDDMLRRFMKEPVCCAGQDQERRGRDECLFEVLPRRHLAAQQFGPLGFGPYPLED